MKAFILSDLHVDTWFSYAVNPSRCRKDDPSESVVSDTMDFLWKTYEFPNTDAIIIAGDVANDFLTYSRAVKWLSGHYKHVYLCVGNHDILVRGATPSKSNLKFMLSEDKLNSIVALSKAYENVHVLEDSSHSGVAGCMGMCDLRCDAFPGLDYRTRWRRNWFDGKHWKYMDQEPGAIWNHYDAVMTGLCGESPKVMMTHFAPYEVGVNWKYRNSPSNLFFYFNASKYLDMLPDGSTWVCGHIHDRKICNWVNSSGGRIRILCNPFGYPGEGSAETDVVSVEGDRIVRSTRRTSYEDYILEL